MTGVHLQHPKKGHSPCCASDRQALAIKAKVPTTMGISSNQQAGYTLRSCLMWLGFQNGLKTEFLLGKSSGDFHCHD